ncbi:MAG: hypothetical protein FJ319_04120 [SAR202 cluster bacterium]|nr:hypothetical protein [SAR202 cluster bacterium]
MLRKLPLPVIAFIIMGGVALTFFGMGVYAFGGDPAGGNFAILWGATLVLGAIGIGLLQADMRTPGYLTLAGAAVCLALALLVTYVRWAVP